MLSLAVCLLVGCARDAQEGNTGPASLAVPTVSVTRIIALPMADKLTASGILLPREEAAVGPEVAGYQVAEVLVEEGAAGQPGTAAGPA